jgi:hypothetical protein
MVDSQNTPTAANEQITTQDISYNGFTGVLSFYNGIGTVQATASHAITASYVKNAVTASYVLIPLSTSYD